MSPEDLVSQLAGIRIPEGFARVGVRDALTIVALGLVAGLMISAVLRLVTLRRERPVDEARRAIHALADPDPQVRVTGLAILLRDQGGEQVEGLKRALYDPRETVDPIALEAAVLSAARRRKRP
ncbi:hypothetical protein MLD63_03730 [Paracoccus sp. TK19116]|uniref:HEAT repeat domain-containing protein n=1 Tax=Paracoccus albicereus TaxID=2922394 RepID=A0ABT1MPU1_9RHOB|nr:hypothetical protein [Paracoccus albicereus]MCQ0969546.1 hypothetical protein [Paracoccus albicereus]